MSRLMEMFSLAVAMISTLWFVQMALTYMEKTEKRNGFLKEISPLWLSGVVIAAICLISASSSAFKICNICSLGILLVIAIIDEATGYIYDGWNYLILVGNMVFALSRFPRGLTEREWKLILIYMLFVILMGIVHGMGAGDVPVFMALLLYYLRTATFPADAAIFVLLLSLGIGSVRCLINRKKWMPLAPAIWLAHLITACVWV